MSLRPAVLMIHQETLIVAFDKTRPHQLGHGPADRRHARIPNALADLPFHDPFSFSRVGRQLALRGARRPHLAGSRATLIVPPPPRRDRGRQPSPEPDQYPPLAPTPPRPPRTPPSR